MTEHPILFSAPMVRALLSGGKTQTRRVVKPQPTFFGSMTDPSTPFKTLDVGLHCQIICPYGKPGDRLWVKESIIRGYCGDMDMSSYAADESPTNADAWPWKRKTLSSMFCPRGLSRITLEVTGVRVERLQDIGEEDVFAEGIQKDGVIACVDLPNGNRCHGIPKAVYESLWESINGSGSWDVNPWVWCISFRRLP